MTLHRTVIRTGLILRCATLVSIGLPKSSLADHNNNRWKLYRWPWGRDSNLDGRLVGDRGVGTAGAGYGRRAKVIFLLAAFNSIHRKYNSAHPCFLW